MSYRALVRSGDTEFYVDLDQDGNAHNVSADDNTYSFENIRDTVSTIAEQMATVWTKVKPNEATIDFGLKLTLKSGKLIGILVDGSTEASLSVTLKWTNPQADS